MQINNYCICYFLTMQQYHIHTPIRYAAQTTNMNHHVQPIVADHLGEVYHQTNHLKYHVIALAQKLAVVLKRLEASEAIFLIYSSRYILGRSLWSPRCGWRSKTLKYGKSG